MKFPEDSATKDQSAAFLISELRSARHDSSLQRLTFRILAVVCSILSVLPNVDGNRQIAFLVIALAVAIVWFIKAGASESKANRLETLIIDAVLGDEGGDSAKTLARWDFTEWKEPAWMSSKWEPFLWLVINFIVVASILV